MSKKQIVIPKTVITLPRGIKIYMINDKALLVNFLNTENVVAVDTSKKACEQYGCGLFPGDIIRLRDTGGSDDGKIAVAVGIAKYIGKGNYGYRMWFYIEGDKGVSCFGHISKTSEKIGHTRL